MADEEKKKIGRTFRGAQSDRSLRGRDLNLSLPYVRVAGELINMDDVSSMIRGKLRVSDDDPQATYLTDKLDSNYFTITGDYLVQVKKADEADTVDSYHANSTPTANTLLPLDGSAKFPNSVLYTGSGNGLDADKVDGADATATPTADSIPIAGADGKLASGWMEFTNSLDTKGYQKLPGGLIIQWGRVTNDGTGAVAETFAIEFPNDLLAMAISDNRDTSSKHTYYASNRTKTGFTAEWRSSDGSANDNTNLVMHYIAVGY